MIASTIGIPWLKNPLHGMTLEKFLSRLVEYYGWERPGSMIRINCFTKDPSIKSSLTFLRRRQWARKKVEILYLQTRFSEGKEKREGTKWQRLAG